MLFRRFKGMGKLVVLALVAAAVRQDRATIARDPEASLKDRLAAIRDLRTSTQNDEEAARLIRDIATDGNEPETIRRRATQSLGWIIGNPRSRQYAGARESLRKIHETDPSPTVRAMALKALHFATHDPENKTFRAWMLGIAKDRALKTELRVAAAWALGSASTYADVTPELKRLFVDSTEEAPVRAQALKSLHLFMAQRDCWSPALAVAQDAQLEVELREAAILFLWTAKAKEKAVEEALRNLTRDSSERIREAAVVALDESVSHRQEILRFFRFRNDYILRRPIEVLEFE